MSKLLVLYVFHIYNSRVEHFINNCMFNDDAVDFVLISNDKTAIINVPRHLRFKYLFRENVGYDFGGWSDALFAEEEQYKNYDYFLFINSSTVGPFLPNEYKGKWTDIYVNGLKDNVKLFGSTINADGNPHNGKSHVQSYIFCMNRETLLYLMECEIFSKTNYANTFKDAIWEKEVRMSQKIVEKGWNIGSLLRIYSGVDFTFKTKRPEDYGIVFYQDVMFPHYMDVLWDIRELVFVKGNRIGM